jgi:hypothetical protein
MQLHLHRSFWRKERIRYIFAYEKQRKKGKRCMIRNRKLPDLQKEIFLPAVVNLVGGRKVNVINRGSL